MHPSTMSIFTATRISLYLSVFFLLLLTIGVGGCNTEYSKQNGPGQAPAGATPTTSPSPVRSPSFKPPGDTIIVIKDGSIDLDFDETTQWLQSTASSPYELQNDKLKEVRITPEGGSTTRYPISNPNTTVKINAGGTVHDIILVGKSTTTSNIIQLTFGKNEYKDCSKPGRKHCNDNNKIKEVQIGSSAPVDCKNKKCEVVICTQTSSDPHCQ